MKLTLIVKRWMTNHPILAFVFLTYLLTIFIWCLILTFYGRVPIDDLVSLPLGIPLIYVGAGAPTIVAIILTGMIDGRVGLVELRERVMRIRIGVLPWVVAIGVPFACAFGAVAFFSMFSDGLGERENQPLYAMFPLSIIVLFFAGPLCEETGWRGYLQPRLLRITTPLKSVFIIGIVWCFWHIPLSFTPGTTPVLDGIVPWFQYLVSATVVSGIMLFIVVKGGGSIAVAMIFHWASNAALGSVVLPMYPEASSEALRYVELVQTGFLLLVAVLLLTWLSYGYLQDNNRT